jgi:hypothetical protein
MSLRSQSGENRMSVTPNRFGKPHKRHLINTLVACLGLLAASVASVSDLRADLITDISIFNQSSGPPSFPNLTFQTQSTLSSVTTVGSTAFFTHRMAVWNRLGANGGVAQINKGNVVYQMDFTVNDPLNQGYDISLNNVLRGISLIDITSNPNNALCWSTGLNLAAYDGAIFLAGVSGTTLGTGFKTAGYHALYEEYSGNQTLGSYLGTQAFSLLLTSIPTPTTNVAFANGATGNGEVIYGLGSIPSGFGQYDMDDLGHFLTVKVTMNAVPEPGTAGILCSALTCLLFTRRQRKH